MIEQKVDKLFKARFIQETSYSEWIANMVMIKKANGKWRICINYIKLNKVCFKDNFFLPRIDQLVYTTSNHKLSSFMDVFSNYNQIQMAPEDEEKTAIVTTQGLYYHKMMSFGLKNADATYQYTTRNLLVSDDKKATTNSSIYR